MKGAVPTQEGTAPFAVRAIRADSGMRGGIAGHKTARHGIAVHKRAVRDVRMLYVRSVTGPL
ncbi:hypothetical protein GCM10010449_45320 [Streptomyces rectiviolaceus]|uniref:Transposase n=1 Tax=Streptomyces rectiviolaceus TaxID=332591 RepID=A0ABP6MPS7_9ACTN